MTITLYIVLAYAAETDSEEPVFAFLSQEEAEELANTSFAKYRVAPCDFKLDD